jgi:hypothetical protein
MPHEQAWPALPVESWQDTRDTLHMWTQIVGKVCLELAPVVNHWWGITFRVTSTGLITPVLPYRGYGLHFDFDFERHVLSIRTTPGASGQIKLEPRSVADFYEEFRGRLAELDIEVPIYTRPVEVAVAIPFPEDTEHASYDSVAVETFGRTLVDGDRVMSEFKSRFIGKASPVHFFWGAFDLAVTRFSGRRAPRHPGGAPNCADWVMEEAYSHEASSSGYWPGAASEGMFYSYAYPEPEGFKDRSIVGASYDETWGEFMIDYADVRKASDPDASLLEFFQSTYEAAADLGNWNRKELERDPRVIETRLGRR